MTASTAAVLLDPDSGTYPQGGGPTRGFGEHRLETPSPLTLCRVRHDDDEGWDRTGFRDYVLANAARLGMQRPADIARASNVTPSQLSKWLRGVEQPSVLSLQRIAEGLRVPRRDLYSLAGRFSDEDLEITDAPAAPVLAHPLAREIDAMLSESSPLDASRRESLVTVLDAVLVSWRGEMRRRRTA